MKNKTIFILSLAVFFIAYSAKAGFPQSELNLSGKYKGYNVILIILDALRPDHLSCYGYGLETSPNIDALAKEGVLFTNAFAQASYTLPSVTSIFTSVYPYSHGVVHVFKDKVPDKIDTLAQVLSKYGYNTAWFGILDDPHTGNALGQLKGFKEKIQLFTTNGQQMYKDNKVVFNWIDKHNQEPFFITIHSYSVHEHFFPKIMFFNKFYQSIPQDFLESLDRQKKKEWDYLIQKLRENPKKINSVFGEELVKEYLMQPYQQEKFSEFEKLLETNEQKMFLEEIDRNVCIPFLKSLQGAGLRDLLTLLDSAIYAVDNNLIGGLTRYLEENNLLENTVIIVTADHGNEFLEHGEFGHGSWLYDEVMHVPLIIRLPNLQKPVVVKGQVQAGIDMLPTILDLLSIPISHQTQGISLVGLIAGEKRALNDEYVFCQGIPLGTIAIRSNNWKFIRQLGESRGEAKKFNESLFNLNKDPGELRNVIKENPRIAERLKSRLEAWQRSLVVYQAEEREFMPGIGEETKERIRKTGYW